MKIVTLAAALCLATPVSALLADELPKRKPGLWEVKSTGSGAAAMIGGAIKQCIDATTDKGAMNMAMAGGNCTQVRLVKTAAGYESETTCKMGPLTSTGKATITGDFNSSLKMESTTTVSGAPGSTQPITTKSMIEARWVGPCAPGQKPGDVIMPDGKVISLPAAAPKRP